MVVKVLIIMADNGHDPTEVAVPYHAFKSAGFHVSFATERGQVPRCDARMLEGFTHKLLGATAGVVKLYNAMSESSEMQNPLAWTSAGFTLDDFDVVHIPGGHDSQVRQLLDSASAQNLIADFFPQTKRPGRKIVASICHGPLLLSNAKAADGKSVLYDCETTTLPSFFESFIYQGTRVFLGDYYKTYGADSENCEESVRKVLRDPSQLKSSWVPNQPFVVQDPEYNYISARFPGDAERFSEMIVNLALSQS